MITTIKKFKSYLINEQLISNDNEYFDTVKLFYDDELIKQIHQGEFMAKSMTNSKIKTFKTDNENFTDELKDKIKQLYKNNI
jgi:hypothetical protein